MSPADKDLQLESAAPVALATLSEALSHAAHELRGPLSVMVGYLRMLLKDPPTMSVDQQRHLLELVDRSCGRFHELLKEVSDLAKLEKDGAKLNRGAVDLLRLLNEASAELSPMPDREVAVDVTGVSVRVNADALQLKAAFRSILFALRRELVASDRIAVRVDRDSPQSVIIRIGEAARFDRLLNSSPEDLGIFDERRGGCGMTLAIARLVLEAHGGSLSGLCQTKVAAIIAMPTHDI
jgi:two-component system phosphate regulon sensor histidine kinase PhoR